MRAPHRDMSSISAQGVVERASAELTKRINGLGLRTSKHHGRCWNPFLLLFSSSPSPPLPPLRRIVVLPTFFLSTLPSLRAPTSLYRRHHYHRLLLLLPLLLFFFFFLFLLLLVVTCVTQRLVCLRVKSAYGRRFDFSPLSGTRGTRANRPRRSVSSLSSARTTVENKSEEG